MEGKHNNQSYPVDNKKSLKYKKITNEAREKLIEMVVIYSYI